MICQILQPECDPVCANFGFMKLYGHCGFCSLVYAITLWGFLWRSFIINIEWWCLVLTKASAAVVWHAFPLVLPRLETRGWGGGTFRMLKTLMETMNCGSQENFRVRRIARSVWNQAMLDVLQTCWCSYGLMPSVVEKHMGNSQEMDVVFETVAVLSCDCRCSRRDLLVLWVALRGRLLRLNWSVWPVWGEWFAVSFFHFCLSLPSRHKWQSCLVVGKGGLPTRAWALCQVLFLWLRLCRPSYECPIFDCSVNY